VLIHTSRNIERIPGPDVEIDCPACGRHAYATTFEQTERMAIYFIPLPAQRETFVVCGACRTELVSTLPISQMTGISSYELSKAIGHRVSMVGTLGAVCGVLFCWVPLFGLIMAVTGYALSYRAGGWRKALSLLGIPLSLGLTILMFIWMNNVK
jgi:hypothetical protein